MAKRNSIGIFHGAGALGHHEGIRWGGPKGGRQGEIPAAPRNLSLTYIEPTLYATVTNEDNAPISGVTVTLRVSVIGGAPETRTATTGASGIAEFIVNRSEAGPTNLTVSAPRAPEQEMELPAADGPLPPNLRVGTVLNPAFGLVIQLDDDTGIGHNPFNNWLKLASEWKTSGITPQQGYNDLVAGGHLSANGTINSIPAGADNVVMNVLAGVPAESADVGGRYRLYYTGTGSISLNGADSVGWPATGRAEFDFYPDGEAHVSILVTAVTSPLTFTALVHQDDWAAYEAGEIFRRSWLDLIRNQRIIRFTSWMNTDRLAGPVSWASRYTPERITYQGGQGVPVEVMCALCEAVGADPWFSLPSGADDNYVEQFAQVVNAELSAHRHVYVELSNKVWDGANWATADYFRDLSALWFGGDTSIEGSMEAYGGRSAEVFARWRSRMSGARVRTVLQGWTPNTYVTSFICNAPRWVALGSGRQAPYRSATEWALHANLDGGIRYEGDDGGVPYTNTATVQGWIDTLSTSALTARVADAMRTLQPGMTGGGYVLDQLITAWNEQAIDIQVNYPGLNVIGYEAGWHCAVPPSKQSDPAWMMMLLRFAISADAAAVQDEAIAAWFSVFGADSPYVRKNDVQMPDVNNIYGLRFFHDSTAAPYPQLDGWNAQVNAREGAAGRGNTAFIGTADLT